MWKIILILPTLSIGYVMPFRYEDIRSSGVVRGRGLVYKKYFLGKNCVSEKF
jgi:hypothetical protein